MPKEKISSHGPDSDTLVEVGWPSTGGSTVLVGATASDAVDAAASAAANGFEFRGFACALDQPALDHLIRTLQRARRQTFGGDAALDHDGQARAEGTPV